MGARPPDLPCVPPPPDRWERYVDAMERGRLTVDQVRAMEGLPPLPKTPVDWSGVDVGVQTEDYGVQADGGRGERVCRRYIVTGIPQEQGTNEGAMVLAVRAPGVPRIGDPHPMREDLLVSDIRASADAEHGPYMAHVEVTYSPRPDIHAVTGERMYRWNDDPRPRRWPPEQQVMVDAGAWMEEVLTGTQAWKLALATAAVWVAVVVTGVM